MRAYIKTTWIILIALLMTIVLSISSACPVHAKEDRQKVVRVGWFDSSFCYYDKFNRRCGIAYEYQRKIAAYTGWTYEYVEESWPNLFQMLKDGEIDLLCDVSYKPEREEYMSFPDIPMGAESYYIYVDAGNRDISSDDLSSFNGKRIGVNQGSIQEGFLKDWAEKGDFDIEIVPMVIDEDESMDMLTEGGIDGYASIYTFSSEQKVIPVCRIGSSDYYYAVNKNRPDLLAELNMALAGIQDDDPDFNRRLSEERVYNVRTNAFLTPAQEDWISGHGTIRIGYQDNYLPFCDADDESGELTGALKDYLAHATNNLRKSGVVFETQPYSSGREALDAMKRGEVDCVFPLYLSSYDCEQEGIWLTSTVMKTEMNAVMRVSDNRGISQDSEFRFAVPEGDLSIETFIMEQYPSGSIEYFADREACCRAVSGSRADCTLASNYRMPAAEDILTRYKLFSVPSGESIPLSFAVNYENRELYFLLNKTVAMTRSEDMDSSLVSYMQYDYRVSFSQFMKDNWIYIIVAISVVFFAILFLLLQKLKAEKKLNDQQKLMEDALRRELEHKEKLQSAMDMAFKDPLTGVKSKRAYKDAEDRMDRRIEEGSVSEFGVVVFDLNNLKQINDSMGHEAGDEYIKGACKLICTSFKHSPVFRIGGDEFTAILEGDDYLNQEELLYRFEKQILENLQRNRIVIAFGSARFDPQNDKSIRTVFERADSAMYKEKVLLKSFGSDEEEADGEDKQNINEDTPIVRLRKHILIADDIDQNREILGDLLDDDYDILYASDGIEAMEMLRNHKEEIAVLLLDLYMPNMSGREVMAEMQIDEELMSIPVIVISIDEKAELDSLKTGAMDFIPKPYPDIEIIKARISNCIELAENRDIIRSTQRDKLTGLFSFEYFLRYVVRYDRYYKDIIFDAVAIDINNFYSINEQYGRQFGDLVLRSVGISLHKFARKTGGIGCRKEKDIFLLYCPRQDNYEKVFEAFTESLFLDKEMAGKVSLRFGIFADARQEKDIELRFANAVSAALSVKNEPGKICGYF